MKPAMVLLALVACANSAFAQQRESTAFPASESAQYTPQQLNRARAASALATVVPIVAGYLLVSSSNHSYRDPTPPNATAVNIGASLMVAGYLVGPSVGYFSTGRSWPAVRGMLLRFAAPLAGLVAAAAMCPGSCDGGSAPFMSFMSLVGGVTAGAASAVHDISAAGKAPR
jgi:hypothetical protein